MKTSKAFSILLWGPIRRAGGTEEGLRAALADMEKPVVVAFDQEFRRAMANLWTIPVRGSEDMKKDIYAHVVSKGAAYYDEIVSHPERIPQDVGPGDPCFIGVAGEVFFERFGEEITLQD